MTQYVIGIGTGRCGTMTLAKLINGCRRVLVFHEMTKMFSNAYDYVWMWHMANPEGREKLVEYHKRQQGITDVNVSGYFETLPWKFDKQRAGDKAKDLLALKKTKQLCGDVAFYYLNYVEYMNKKLSDLKIIHVWRDKAEVIDSLNRRSGPFNWWSSRQVKDNYSQGFPTYQDDIDKLQAIEKYIDEYMLKAEQLQRKFKHRFLKIKINDLLKSQNEVFEFLEIPVEFRQFQSEDFIKNKSERT